MDSMLDLDLAIINNDASDLPSMDEEDKTTGMDIIEGSENNSTDYKTTYEEQHFTILSESDIKRLQDTDINKVSCVLLMPRVVACLLLIHHEWSVLKVLEAWFDDEAKVRKAVGLLKQHEAQVGFPNSKTLTCEICFDAVSCDKVRSAGCGHLYCILCWKQYVDTSIDEGPDKCLKLRCPQPSCDAAVGGDMIHEIASESKRNKYDRFLFRSYVENNKKVNWCPAPACEYAVSYEPHDARTNIDVTCLCYHSFCWSCGEEAHSPVDCETVKQWIVENDSISESSKNTTWVLTNTKPCPTCKKPIEKIEGYVNMGCKCGFHFCWLCLRDWSKCKHTCKNIYEEEVERQMVIDDLKNCTYYYQRWVNNDVLRKNALRHLKGLMNAGHIERMRMLYGRSEDDFEFIEVAWQQLIECRRVLKWTYPCEYYLPQGERAKREFFECMRDEAEAVMEKLHLCAEKELAKFLYADEPENSFDSFRWKLMELTRVTKTYFENMVRAFQDGLAEVHVKTYAGIKRGTTEIGESSTAKKRRRRRILNGDR